MVKITFRIKNCIENDIVLTDEEKISATYASPRDFSSLLYQQIVSLFKELKRSEFWANGGVGRSEFWYVVKKMSEKAEKEGKRFPSHNAMYSWIRDLELGKKEPRMPRPEKCVQWLERHGILSYDLEEEMRTLRSINPCFPAINLLNLLCIFTGNNIEYIPKITGRNTEILELLEFQIENALNIELEIIHSAGSNILVPRKGGVKYLGRLLSLLGCPKKPKKKGLRGLPWYIDVLGSEFKEDCAKIIYSASGRYLENKEHSQIRIRVPGILDPRYSKKMIKDVKNLFEDVVGVPFNSYIDKRGEVITAEIYSIRLKEYLSKGEYHTAIERFLDSIIEKI